MTRWFDEKNGVVVVHMPLPLGVAEAITPNEDDTHTVIISDRITESQARQAYRHALSHIRHGDFQSAEDVQTIERRCHESA